MNNKLLDYFKNVSINNSISQAFLIGNVSFDSFKNDLTTILENFFFKQKVDVLNNPDIYILRQNNTLITKNDIKELLLNLSFTSQFNNIKVYIIENCEKLTDNVYNALLKTLEEPEKGIYAFLLTKNISAVKPTISSRCQKIFISSNNDEVVKSEYGNIAKEFVDYIEEKGILTIVDNCNIYSKIKDKLEFNNILINMLDIYKNLFKDIMDKNVNDKDLNIVVKNDTNKILKKILIINEYIYYLKNNLNKNLCIDRFIIDMWRCGE